VSRSDAKRLDDMREMCAVIERLAARGREAFGADIALPLALERALEVLGEAAGNVSDEARVRFPTVEWRDITRLRIRLAHHYHRVQHDQLWTIAVDEVPKVARALGPLVATQDE
jgi:uncharacterized protein with HEPN domain